MERRVVTVFGGSGFVGRHLVRRLAADGWIVRVGVRDPESAKFLMTCGDVAQVVPMAADVTRRPSVEAVVAGADAVVNLVGILYEKGSRTFRRVHVEGAQIVAETAKAAGVGRLVQMSALGADPDSSAEYGRTKAAGEDAARAAFPSVAVTRPSVVFGPEDDFFNRFAAMARFLPALPVFETRFQPVHVGDVAEAILRILDRAETVGKTYELGGPKIYSFRELMQVLLEEIGRDRLLLPLPLSVASFEAWFLEWLPVPPLTRDQVELLRRDNVVTPGALGFADLGIEPTALEVVIPTYLHRYRPQVKMRRRMR